MLYLKQSSPFREKHTSDMPLTNFAGAKINVAKQVSSQLGV